MIRSELLFEFRLDPDLPAAAVDRELFDLLWSRLVEVMRTSARLLGSPGGTATRLQGVVVCALCGADRSAYDRRPDGLRLPDVPEHGLIQTFLTHPNFARSAKALDTPRLGKRGARHPVSTCCRRESASRELHRRGAPPHAGWPSRRPALTTSTSVKSDQRICRDSCA